MPKRKSYKPKTTNRKWAKEVPKSVIPWQLLRDIKRNNNKNKGV